LGIFKEVERRCFDKIIATRVGVHAVDMIHNDEFGKMAAVSGNRIVSVPLEDAAGKSKLVGEEWIKFKNIFNK